MKVQFSGFVWATAALTAVLALLPVVRVQAGPSEPGKTEFRTSDRCVACHNGLKTSAGEDISIGLQWRASIMANSSRDPYWQGSVRRESIDHPESQADIENECSACHMPMAHLMARDAGQKTRVFAHLPLIPDHKGAQEAADGVSCSVCHQIESTGLGTPATFNGNVVVAGPKHASERPEFGPFSIDEPHQRIMLSSTAGFVPTEGTHIRDSSLCGSCHTLYTKALGPGGKEIGRLPEQVPYQEWLHSAYVKTRTCQECHMPQVDEPTRVTAVYGPERNGMHRHVFVGGNFLMESMLGAHREELGMKATVEEMRAAQERTAEFLQKETARMTIPTIDTTGNRISFAVKVENLTGHKFPTAYPSRRAWLHVMVQDRDGQMVFESGALRDDGAIEGNDNDADPHRFEPHFAEITSPAQVEIFESILRDSSGGVTTGLLSAVGYLKDNRILPAGFDKRTAEPDIAVIGAAADDPNFTDQGSTIRYRIDGGRAAGPFHVRAELWYQPIGFRWARNLASYKGDEPRRFVGYYEAESRHSALVIASAEVTR
jgi:hypothetical protein